MTKMRVISGKDDMELAECFNTFSAEIGDKLVSYESLDRYTMRVFYKDEIEKVEAKKPEPTFHSGQCAMCKYFTSANLGRTNCGRVKWGRCALLNNAAINEAHTGCDMYEED